MNKTQSRQASELRFTSLKLENWKNFKKVDVLLPRRVLLVGANASGKSNLLDVFRFLHDLAGDVGGGFQEAVNRKRGGVSRIRSLAARRYPDVAIEVTLGSDEEPFVWRYRLAFGQDNQRRPQITHESVHHKGTKCSLALTRRTDSIRCASPRPTLSRLCATGIFAKSRVFPLCPIPSRGSPAHAGSRAFCWPNQ